MMNSHVKDKDVKYIYLGCFKDDSSRLFDTWAIKGAKLMSADVCLKSCSQKPSTYQYFATEYSWECFCGRSGELDTKRYPKLAESACDRVCTGNGPEKCGGTWAASVYRILHVTDTRVSTETLTTVEYSISPLQTSALPSRTDGLIETTSVTNISTNTTYKISEITTPSPIGLDVLAVISVLLLLCIAALIIGIVLLRKRLSNKRKHEETVRISLQDSNTDMREKGNSTYRHSDETIDSNINRHVSSQRDFVYSKASHVEQEDDTQRKGQNEGYVYLETDNYNTLNEVFKGPDDNIAIYSHAVDDVYDLTKHNCRPKAMENTYATSGTDDNIYCCTQSNKSVTGVVENVYDTA